MSIQAINKYHNEVYEIYQYSGQDHEQAIKNKFADLINVYCKKHNLRLINEITIETELSKKNIRPDGIIKNILQMDCGYWESKANVNLENEIIDKINAGYKLNNTLFQDNKVAILYQDGKCCLTAQLDDVHNLDNLLNKFVNFKTKEVKEFDNAVEKFKEHLPNILDVLRTTIANQEQKNQIFINAQEKFLKICKSSINSKITHSDINEMLLQHILTEELFTSVFDNAQFHRENNIAKELYAIEDTFFKGAIKHNTLEKIKPFYRVIRTNAANIANYHDKQSFLKTIYEDFYKIYNPKAADKMGIVYTPHEIVKFQIESVDYLLEKHFGKSLANKDVKILDPCVGTGTYICDLIDYLPANKLEHKYKNDIYANELGLLPYYIANLNIEYTYYQKMQKYFEQHKVEDFDCTFNNLCWVDTLDNTGFGMKGTNTEMFGLSIENTARIKEQNTHKISVIMGNPPYNAKQDNYNQQNANRIYKDIDLEIKKTYIKHGTAQNKNQVYDMYLRFFRWASNRINENGIISFITNRSYLDAIAFDGVRLTMQKEFSYIYCIDLGGDITNRQDKSLPTGNVFDIKTGVAIIFLIKKEEIRLPQMFYYKLSDAFNKSEKLNIISSLAMQSIEFEKIIPDKNNNWINQSDNDFETLIPLINKEVKSGKSKEAIFKLFSIGVKTQRDEWVYDFNRNSLKNKMQFFISIYQKILKNTDVEDKYLIKFDRELDKYLTRKITKKFEETKIIKSLYRPFVK